MYSSSTLMAVAIGFFVTLCAIPPLVSLAKFVGMMDFPSERKQHGHPVPLVGGVAIFIGLLSITFYLSVFGWLLLCTGLLMAVGILDDKYHIGVRLRLFVQLVVAVLMGLGSGVWIDSLGTFWGYDFNLGLMAIPFTLFAVVGLTNAFNMLDGIDGLASGHGVVTAFSLLVSSLLIGQPIHVSWVLGLAATITAFWLVNVRFIQVAPRVFLGDAGSTAIGFILAWLLIGYSQKPWGVMDPVMALWCLSIPVVDTVAVIFRRLKQKRSPFSPDRTHLHHLMIDGGLTLKSALRIMLVGAFAINMAGLLVTKLLGVEAGLTLFVLFSATCTYIIVSSDGQRRFLRLISSSESHSS